MKSDQTYHEIIGKNNSDGKSVNPRTAHTKVSVHVEYSPWYRLNHSILSLYSGCRSSCAFQRSNQQQPVKD